MSLAKKTIIGIVWKFTEQLSRQGIGIFVSLLLARILVPSDFGLISMMAVFIAIGNSLMDSGFKEALIRKHGATQTYFCTAFYANLGLGGLSYLLLFSLAPFIAAFYNEPRLTFLIRIAGVTILINAFQIVQSATLNRNLNFKAQLKATIPATIISGFVAVVMAYNGFGVWALIIQMVISALLVTIFLWSMNLWRPTLTFSNQALAEMFGFGSKLFLSGLLNTVFKNLYVVTIAKLFAANIAGYYFFANSIKDLILSQLVNSIQTVTYPALATLQEDNIRLKDGYRRIIQVTTFVLFPGILLVTAFAEPLFELFLNDAWYPAVPYLQLMCIAGVMYPLHSINLNILQVKGRSDLFLYLEIIKKMSIVVILLVSIQFGVMGILIGQVISSVLSYLPNSYFSGRLINYSAREQIHDFFPALLLSIIIATLTFFAVEVSTLSALLEILLFGPPAIGIYFLSCYVLNLKALEFMEPILKPKLYSFYSSIKR